MSITFKILKNYHSLFVTVDKLTNFKLGCQPSRIFLDCPEFLGAVRCGWDFALDPAGKPYLAAASQRGGGGKGKERNKEWEGRNDEKALQHPEFLTWKVGNPNFKSFGKLTFATCLSRTLYYRNDVMTVT